MGLEAMLKSQGVKDPAKAAWRVSPNGGRKLKKPLMHHGGLCWCGKLHNSIRQAKAVFNQVPMFLWGWLARGLKVGSGKGRK